MYTKIFSIDDLEVIAVDDDPFMPTQAPGVIPIRPPPIEDIEACVLVWEGELDLLPEIGDALALPGEYATVEGVVIARVFHLDRAEIGPLLTLFVSNGE